MDRNSQPIQRGRPVSGLEAAHANEYFEQFLNASSLKHILGYYRGLIDYLHLKPNVFLSFYPKLRANLTSWRAKALWKKIDARAAHKCYLKGKAASNTRVLIIGGGPCGLRTAIEAQLLGAKVVLIEKRDRFSRNNVLHLWPFVIEDLRMLGAKKFFGKFCAGAIDHISIRRLQCILLKVALLLGVEVHTEVGFEKLIEPNPNEKTGWRAEVKPSDHPVSQYEFDVIIGADGKRNTLQGFTRKEFRGKLAIAITANFINKRTEAEARVEEISGVAFIFNQKFFKDLQEATRIDLENIVYYKDDTHYFVMTAKKASLIEKGVIKQDLADTEKLLAPENVNREALEAYAIEAANFSTNYQMPDLEFAVNHYGQPDIAMFDFTSMFAADNASKVIERNGYRLLMILVGDSLLEPFWPTGSGCARGFLSSLDAAWAIRSWSLGTLTALDVLAERESIYRLLAQTTPDNLNKDWKSYTLDPSTRYPNLNKAVVMSHQTISLYETDNPASIERMKRNAQERPNEVPKKRRRENVDNEVLLNWISEQLRSHEDNTVTDIGSIFKYGKILCAMVHHYRPDLLDYCAIKDGDPSKNNQLAFDILEKELGIPPIMTGEESTNTEDYLTMATYLTQVYDTFRGEIPHIKQPKLKLRSKIPKSLTFSQVKPCPTSSKTNQKKVSHNKNNIENAALKTEDNKHKSSFVNNTDLNSEVQASKSKDIKTLKSKTSSLPLKKNTERGSSISCDKKKKISNVKHKQSTEIGVEVNKKPSKHSSPLQRGIDKLKLLHVAKKSPKKTKTNHSFEICKFNNSPLENSSEKLLYINSNHHSTEFESNENNLTGENVVYKKSVINLSVKCHDKIKKEKSKTALRKKKMHMKKSKLSVIPEIKIELTEEKRSATTVCFPHTISDSTTHVSKADHLRSCKKYINYNTEIQTKLQEKVPDSNDEEHGNYECQTIYNNSYFRKFKKTCRNMYPNGRCKTNPSDGIKIPKKQSIPKVEYASNSDTMIKIRLFEKKNKNNITFQQIDFVSSLNLLTISSKTCVTKKYNRSISCHSKKPLTSSLVSKNQSNLKSSYINANYIPPRSNTNFAPFPNKSCKYKNPSCNYKNPPCKYTSNDLWIGKMECGDGRILVPSKLQKILHELGSRGHHKNLSNYKCHMKINSHHKCKFPSKKMTMSEGDGLPDQIYSRVSNWISSHDFQVRDPGKIDAEAETVISNDIPSDITSVTRTMAKKRGEYDDIVIEERTDVVKCRECESPITSDRNFSEMVKNLSNNKSVRTLSKFSQYSPFHNSGNLKSASAPPTQFSVIVEGEESELPESNKRSELSFKTIKTSNFQPVVPTQVSRPSSRHKRHADAMVPSKAPSIDRKTRKRRTLEKIGASVEERQKMLEEIASNRAERQNRRRQQRKLQTEHFLKSMQMLQANARDPEPFEDYSIFLYRQTAPKFEDRVKDLEKQFTYVPDHENKMPNLSSRTTGADEDLAARIKSFENKLRDPQPVDKKPKDLLRAIGKIETSDWNIKEIEKKIKENKMGKPSKVYDKEKVPKWSKEQFIARQTKMEKQHLDRQDSAEAKYADIDKSIKHLDQKLKEGTIRELGQNKVASITEKLVNKVPQETKVVEKTNTRPVLLPTQGGSEFCHFCGKRVYLMERLSAEGRFFHHGCFKCQYCNTQLRLGSYAFDRDGLYDHKFFCIHHFGMVGELHPVTKVTRKPSQRQPGRSPDKKPAFEGVDLLDRVQTPERAEFANLSTGNASSDHEESISQMDEDEWTDKNFGASCAEMGDSEDDSSSLSDTDSEDEDAFDDALEEPVTKEGTMKWADRWKNSYSKKRHDSDSNGYSSSDQSSYYENSSDDDDSDTATEGEEEIRARELRKQEVRVEPPIVQTDTGTDTEVVSDESSSESSSEIQNSATEISTDSEFAHDDPTPTREIPAIVLNDFNVTKTRGSGGISAKKIQVTSGYLQRPTNGRTKKPDIELKLKPLVPSAPAIKKPAHILLPRTEGYALNRTQSTGGIAAKVSLELKKKYLLGEPAPDCQKLLKPAKEVSASMQTFCKTLNERHSPILSPQPSIIASENIRNEELTKEKEPPPLPPPPDVTNVTSNNTSDNKVPESEPYVFQNESEGRPRSPVHETSIIVPNIDWNKKNQSQSSDSLCTSSTDNENVTTPNHQFENIPRVEVHEANDEDDIPLDSLCVVETNIEKPSQVDSNCSLHSEPSKSITSEKKTLNQPKSLPNLECILPDVHKSLHVNIGKVEKRVSPEIDNISVKNSSGFSSPDSGAEQATAGLTETELSDWARDGVVSDDFEDGEFEVSRESEKHHKKNKAFDISVKTAKSPEFDVVHICGKEKEIKDLRSKTIITETMNSILSANLDNIEFMDTGTETSSDDGVGNSQNGYVLFKDEDDFAEDSLNPNINEVVEATNVHVDEKYEPKNTGYCILATEDKQFGAVVDLKLSDLEKLKQKQISAEPEEDSLLIIETGTTTEENTCSDSTVKNVTEISADKTQPVQKYHAENNTLHKQKLEEKLAKVKEEMALKQQGVSAQGLSEKETIVDNNIAFEEHCQRLQSKVEFGNVKDSIDIRKSRRKSKSDSPQKPDLIQEEKSSPLQSSGSFVLNLTPSQTTPDILYKKEILQKERDVNQKLIQEMVMNKMKAENKSLERKKRHKQISPGLNSNTYGLMKSATTDVLQINEDNSNRNSTYSTGSSTYTTPDVLLSTNLIPLQYSQSVNTVSNIDSSADLFSTPQSSVKELNNRPYSVFACITDRKVDQIKPSQSLKNSENCSMPDIRKNLFGDDFVTPKAPPRLHRLNDEASKTTEKLKQDARARARLLSNEDLGLSPEEKLLKLREKINKRGKENEIVDPHIQESIGSLVMNTDKRNSYLYSNYTLNKKRNNSFKNSQSGEYAEQTSTSKLSTSRNNTECNKEVPVRTKSVSEFPKNFSTAQAIDMQNETKKIYKSDPNLLDTEYVKPKKKNKDRERRKSITKLISTLFTKKSPSSTNSKSLFSKLSPKSKDVSKEIVNEEPVRRRSLSEIERVATTPPPIPPLPLNYTIKDESSEGELDCKKQGRSSCDTLDKSGILDNSTSSLTGRKTSKSARKVARQTQLKRHRMAQEIQRKLEETEVKTRELETRGVLVEKALRGEDSGECLKDEPELLQEWFDLMRDRTELRRYEKELMIRAQELELEDRHARLQHELRERLENNETKTEQDVKIEESIINEMMEIVSKRDSLIAVIEEDRLRYSNEDRDLEEQMLAKGLRLTPIRKTPEK